MARKAAAASVEEVLFKSESAFLCILMNHRNKFIRVIDFRAGALPAKRLYIQTVAQQEGIEKVITLVEKDEVSSWTKVGFVREGTIPGFYKRSDGHLCGCVINNDTTSSTSIADNGPKQADRTVNHSKKGAKSLPEKIRGASVSEIEETTALRTARTNAIKKGEAVNTFDDFGRDAQRFYMSSTVRKGKPVYLSAEFQDCFGHSLVEVLKSPNTDNELLATTAGLREMSDNLKARGIVSAFGFAPSDDVQLGTAYVAAGFRKTGLLAQGIKVGKERKDAILWTRKLMNPGIDDEV